MTYNIMEHITTLLTYLLLLYALIVVIFIVMDNRSPQSTFAWLLLFFVFPVGGVVIYFFFGQDFRAFSRSSQQAGEEITHDLDQLLVPRLPEQTRVIEQMRREANVAYEKKLLELAHRNSLSYLTVHNNLVILQNACQKYRRLIDDLEQARHSIHLAYYIWTSDSFTEKLKDILIQKASAGVEVRLVYDALGTGLAIRRRYIQKLRQGGVEVYPFSPYYKLHTISYRNHRKIAVIDGKIGYTGGLNISQEQLDGGKYFDSWRDTHLRVEGEAALALQAVFMANWYNATNQKLVNETYFPPAQDVDHYLPVQIITSGPDSEWNAIQQLYFLMITAAEKRILIQSPFFIPDAGIATALKAAALSGVEVLMMFAPKGTTYTLPYRAANTYFQDMARAGIRIFLYQKGYFHPKTISIDSRICSIGSANMDIRSFSINYETNAVIYDEKVTRQLEDCFYKDLEDCTEFNLAEYEKINPVRRFGDSVARLLSPLL
jgi:cardiolipin synthase